MKKSNKVEISDAKKTVLPAIPEEIIVPEVARVTEDNDTNEIELNLIERIAKLEAELAKAKSDNAILSKSQRAPGSERKSQVLRLLEERGPISIKGMAEVLQTTTRNVSSVLTAIRNAGYTVHTDNVGQKYIVARPETTPVAE